MSKEIENPLFDEGPNPFQSLGLTPEAVKLLDENSLRLALRGLFRAWSTQYHPDSHPDFTPAQRKKAQENFTAIQSAYAKLGTPEGLGVYRDEYSGRKKSKKDQIIQNLREQIQAQQESESELRYRILQLFGEFLSPESMHNIEDADVLVQDIMARKRDFNAKGRSLSETSFSLIISRGEPYTQKTVFKKNLDNDLEELFPHKEEEWCFSNGSTFYVRAHGEWVERGEIIKPKGWYRLMGESGDRTVLRYEVTSNPKPLEAKLLGTVPIGSIDEILRLRKGLNQPVQRLTPFITIPVTRAKEPEHIYDASLFSPFISEGEILLIINRMEPKLTEGNVIIAELNDGRNMIVGVAFSTRIPTAV